MQPHGRATRPRPSRCSPPEDARSSCRPRPTRVFVDRGVVDYAVRLVLATRDPGQLRPGRPRPSSSPYGASPRASLGLVAAGRALALLRGRGYVLPQDVFDVAPDVLRHRLVLSYEALADGVDADHVLARVARHRPAPRASRRR